ncbi:MAG TPA: YfhO family protein [Cyclobacteriaceae bacterium]|jgi:hypothetical protein|nr:YfhO family protein [Cyclobacteriaceae bacterium]
MKKIDFQKDVLPHVLAIVAFLIVTIIFFNPIFFDNKVLTQEDIQQAQGASKTIADYRNQTGEEALWAPSMFSGMPAYLVSVRWSSGPMAWTKKVMAAFLPHPVANIFLAFVCYYILLLSFKVRPYLAIGGALAFGLSSYMILGLGAGHNARIGAIAFMPLIMAGIHLAFSGKRLLGFAVTGLGLSQHLKENHLQMTYYLMLIVFTYGLAQLIWAYREKRIKEILTSALLLVPAVLIAAGTFFGQFWAIKEYDKYSIRGPLELVNPKVPSNSDGVTKSYAFAYNDRIGEPLSLLIPNIYGGSPMKYLVGDQNSESYKALVNIGDNEMANQLAGYTISYWGDDGAPYYAGAIIVFLFVAGLLLVDKKWIWWAVPLCVLSIVLSWGSNFSAFNYFMFDYFPMYNKFRSVTFALIIALFLMPLIGMIGLEKLLTDGLSKEAKRKLLYAFAASGGLCVLIIMTAGMFNVSRDGEQQLPALFAKALYADRIGLVRSDAWRSLFFIAPVFVILYFGLQKKLSQFGFYALLAFLITMDLSFVDKRSFTKDKFQRKSQSAFAMNAADQFILNDKSYYRVYNIQNPMNEARTSYFHHSLGGYHGAKIRRYQDLYDSCIIAETGKLGRDWQNKLIQFDSYGVLNMLNTKYIVFGTEANNVITNPAANGNAWFVKEVLPVATANEELKKVREVNTKEVAVIQATADRAPSAAFDSLASIRITEHNPKYLKYESQSSTEGFAVFSEIYYKGWHAFIDGNEVEIQRADYVLRALSVPAGKHTIEFKFEPKPYVIGNKVTMASSWAMVLIVLGCLGWSLRKEN